MLKAFDENNNIVFADEATKGKKYHCQCCDEEVIFKKGKIMIPYFSHKVNSDCLLSREKDYKSEWHIRMQNYFPKENIEVRFVDEQTRERHIADVYLPNEKIVIEFQHSPIDADEFYKRSLFHINNGRRIVWVFDESKKECKEGEYGKLIKMPSPEKYWIYNNSYFEWKRNPRKMLDFGLNSSFYNYCAVHIYNGCEGDSIRKICKVYGNTFGNILLSLQAIQLKDLSDYNSLFYDNSYWIKQEPLKSYIDSVNKEINRIKNTNRVVVKVIPKKRRNRCF